MSLSLKDFSLLKEDNGSYIVGHPKGKAVSIPKRGLSDKAHQLIKKLKKEQRLDEGGDVLSVNPENPEMPAPEVLNQNLAQAGAPETIPQMDAQAEQQAAVAAQEPVVQSPVAAAPPAAAQVPLAQNPFVPSGHGLDEVGRSVDQAQRQLQQASRVAREAEIPEMPSVIDIQNQSKAKDQALYDAFAKKEIDPNRFWNNKSTGSKIASTIGVILGGMGAAFTGGKNAALEHINSSIERDIDAQKNDQSRAMNLWKMNREATGNDIQATLHSYNQALSAAKFQVDQAQHVATNAGQQAQLAQLGMGIQAQKDQIQRMNSLMEFNKQPGKSNMDPSVMVQMFVPKEHQAEAFKQMERAQNTKRMQGDILKAFDKSVEATSGLGAAAALVKHPREVSALNQLISTTVTDLTGTARQAEFDNVEKNLMPNSFDTAEDTKTKKAALVSYLQAKSSSPILKGYGVDLDKFRSTSPHSSEKSFGPGSVVSVKGKNYSVGPDGNSLTPVKE